jgi:uncharacterized protein (DUF4415 family)
MMMARSAICPKSIRLCSNPFHPCQTIYKPYCVDAASRNHRLKWLLPYDTSPEVIDAFRATGKGWQTRMDEALKDWLREHSAA